MAIIVQLRKLLRWTTAVLAAGLTALAWPAFPAPPGSRQEALTALASTDAESRASGVRWIAEHGAEADAAPLYDRLRDDSGKVRAYAEQALWLVWSRSGDAGVDRLLERGIEDMNGGNLAAAVQIFSRVIRDKPGFAEGWNKRATALFLAGEFERSLADCAEVLKRNPRHFGALSGAGLNHLQRGDEREALGWLRRALEVNPNMRSIELEVRRLEATLRDKST